MGQTYNTHLKVPKGGSIRVAFVNLNKYTDPITGVTYYNWWAPRPIEIREDKKTPDNTTTADKIVEQTKGEISTKRMPRRFREVFEDMLIEDVFAEVEYDTFTEYPTIDKPKFVLQVHIRGRNVHLDDRRQLNEDFGVGMTHPLPYSLSRQPKNFAEAKALFNKELRAKVERDIADPLRKYLGIKKALVPIEWFGVEGEIKPGEVGATAEEPGFLIILDKGIIEYLTLKPWFHEYYYHGSKMMKGIFMDRLIENRKQWKKVGKDTASWMWFKKSEDKLPYVITRRAVNEHWVPPKGHSALPKEMEAKVPKGFEYWTFTEKAKRLEVRDALFEKLKGRAEKLDDPLAHHLENDHALPDLSNKEGKFRLVKQTWPHTKQVIRAGGL